ncbi:MAG: FimB/Mfa2 family fimbrial subunit [Mediterranea sp.]|nr:FimB/Mfa2 family fimbrial subunit [Mediterranea sp.]
MKQTLSILLLLLWTLVACINEDLSECSVAARISFSFSTQAELAANDTLYDVRLYIVDNEGTIVRTLTYDYVEGNKEYALEVDIPPGVYHLVVWSSHAHPYEVNFSNPATRATAWEEKLKEKIFSLAVPSSQQVNQEIPRLFYGQLYNVSLSATADITLRIPMEEKTNTIHLTVTGLPTDAAQNYELSIADDNGAYHFTGELAPDDDFSYVSTLVPITAKADTLYTRLRVLHLADDRSPLVSLRNTVNGELMYPVHDSHEPDLTELIKEAYKDVDAFAFDRQHIFHLSIHFHADMSVSIGIEQWDDQPTETDLLS